MSIFNKFFKGSNQSVPIRVLKSSTKKVTKTDSNNIRTIISNSNEITEWSIYDNRIEISKENYPSIVVDTVTVNQYSHPPQLIIYRAYGPSEVKSGISVIAIASTLSISVRKNLEDRDETYNIIYDSWQ